MRVVRISVATCQTRLLDPPDDDVRLRQFDAGHNVIEDLDPLLRLHLFTESTARIEMLTVKLELRIVEAVREMPPPSSSDVLVQRRNLGLINDEREDQVDRLVSIVETTPGVPRLIHVSEPHPASQPDPLTCPRAGAALRLAMSWGELRPRRMLLQARPAAGSAGCGRGNSGRCGGPGRRPGAARSTASGRRG